MTPLPDLTPDDAGQVGAALLTDVEAFIGRLVAFPSDHARVAAVLWCAHAHGVEAFESTPRLAALSPEPGSGKTRLLEVLATLVPHPMHAVNATPAALFRAVADAEHRPTLLFDEVDTVFGPKAKDNEELRALLNAGHRRSGVAYRCVGEGTKQRVVAFPAYAALALAGLGDLPDTVMSRSVIVRMRRRSPREHVEPFRARCHEPEGHALRERLADWAKAQVPVWRQAIPDMPNGVTDRPADVWEPLLAVADSAGGGWPDRAREACKALTKVEPSSVSLGVQLLADLRTVFGDEDALHTEDVLGRLHKLADAPWGDLRGKPLDARGLSYRLRKYEVKPVNVNLAGTVRKGYRREHLWDAWTRYLPSPSRESATSATPDDNRQVTSGDAVADEVADGGAPSAIRYPSATNDEPLTSTVTDVAEVADLSEGEDEAHQRALHLVETELGGTVIEDEPPVPVFAPPAAPCEECGRDCSVLVVGRRVHSGCAGGAA